MPTSEGNTASTQEKPVRRDVLRSRQLVVEAASAMFAEHGLDIGYDEIARRAGVGVGTVYRRFPERTELILAVFESRIGGLAELAADAMSQPTGADALRWFLEQVVTVQAGDQGLRDVLAGRAPFDERMQQVRDRLVPAMDRLLDRAKSEGAIRPDIERTDIATLAMVLSLTAHPGQPEMWRRYLTLVLDGLVPQRSGCTPLPIPAPADHDMDHLIRGQ